MCAMCALSLFFLNSAADDASVWTTHKAGCRQKRLGCHPDFFFRLLMCVFAGVTCGAVLCWVFHLRQFFPAKGFLCTVVFFP